MVTCPSNLQYRSQQSKVPLPKFFIHSHCKQHSMENRQRHKQLNMSKDWLQWRNLQQLSQEHLMHMEQPIQLLPRSHLRVPGCYWKLRMDQHHQFDYMPRKATSFQFSPLPKHHQPHLKCQDNSQIGQSDILSTIQPHCLHMELRMQQHEICQPYS